jgi:hypothetical protein
LGGNEIKIGEDHEKSHVPGRARKVLSRHDTCLMAGIEQPLFLLGDRWSQIGSVPVKPQRFKALQPFEILGFG